MPFKLRHFKEAIFAWIELQITSHVPTSLVLHVLSRTHKFLIKCRFFPMWLFSLSLLHASLNSFGGSDILRVGCTLSGQHFCSMRKRSYIEHQLPCSRGLFFFFTLNPSCLRTVSSDIHFVAFFLFVCFTWVLFLSTLDSLSRIRCGWSNSQFHWVARLGVS